MKYDKAELNKVENAVDAVEENDSQVRRQVAEPSSKQNLTGSLQFVRRAQQLRGSYTTISPLVHKTKQLGIMLCNRWSAYACELTCAEKRGDDNDNDNDNDDHNDDHNDDDESLWPQIPVEVDPDAKVPRKRVQKVTEEVSDDDEDDKIRTRSRRRSERRRKRRTRTRTRTKRKRRINRR